MKIELKHITVADLAHDYEDKGDKGVVGYGGLLDIRPAYQREFVYKDKQRDAVVATVLAGLPLNVFYWAKSPDSTYEVLDGQQRISSLCQYVDGTYAIDYMYFHNLSKADKNKILDYELMVYFCEGTNDEKLNWFKTINISGEKLTDQELRNAVYTGPWLESAKRHFSKTGCPAWEIAKDYVRGSPIRQDFLKTAIEWMGQGAIEDYMAENQNQPNANLMWMEFKAAIDWFKLTYPNYRKEMKGLDIGLLYRTYGKNLLDAVTLEEKVKTLMQDDDVTKKQGIYTYLLTHKEKALNIRAFTMSQKRKVYEQQSGICPSCSEEFSFSQMEGDHITPWSQDGKTVVENCQMLCKSCNRTKSNK